MSTRTTRGTENATVRVTLGVVLAFMALNAFGGGWYGLAGAKGVPVELLAGSPFSSYFVPSLILFVVVGGTLLAAAISVFARAQHARTVALGAAVVLLGWIGAQVAIIGYVSWMQPTTAVAGISILLLALRLPRRRAAQ